MVLLDVDVPKSIRCAWLRARMDALRLDYALRAVGPQ